MKTPWTMKTPKEMLDSLTEVIAVLDSGRANDPYIRALLAEFRALAVKLAERLKKDMN
jgi:hypothetical protein